MGGRTGKQGNFFLKNILKYLPLNFFTTARLSCSPVPTWDRSLALALLKRRHLQLNLLKAAALQAGLLASPLRWRPHGAGTSAVRRRPALSFASAHVVYSSALTPINKRRTAISCWPM